MENNDKGSFSASKLSTPNWRYPTWQEDFKFIEDNLGIKLKVVAVNCPACNEPIMSMHSGNFFDTSCLKCGSPVTLHELSEEKTIDDLQGDILESFYDVADIHNVEPRSLTLYQLRYVQSLRDFDPGLKAYWPIEERNDILTKVKRFIMRQLFKRLCAIQISILTLSLAIYRGLVQTR